MAGKDNLTPFTGADDPHRSNGRPKGIPNRKTILNYLLFEADIDELGVIANKPSWFEKVKPKNMYQVMTIAMATKAMSGDEKAFNALNKALGDRVDITSDDAPIPILGVINALPKDDSPSEDTKPEG